jgi:dimethylargininase
MNPEWVGKSVFTGVDFVDVHAEEPMAANALRVGGVVVYPTAFPRTSERLASRGFTLMPIEASELAKAEGAVTCCSIILKSQVSSLQSQQDKPAIHNVRPTGA